MTMNSARTEGQNGAAPKPKRVRSGPLSNREREVFELLADGLSGAEIAESLVLSPETVRTHIRNAMAKLGASTRSQALVIALRRREIASRSETQADEGGGHAPPTPRNRMSPRELTAPLGSVLDGLLALWDVDAGWIYMADDDGLALRQVAERARDERARLPATLTLGEGALGRAALERRSQIVRAPGSEGGALIVAPLLDGGKLIGVLGLATRPSRPTGRQELLLLQALASRIGELVQAGGPRVSAAVEQALDGFRASWASATRPV
jgi:DNA-binding CsgD family transcriptional regulator